jgi:hypothetical protein
MADMSKTAVLDIECYRNFFLVMLRNVATGKTAIFPMFHGQDLETKSIKALLRKYTIVTFNGRNYDMPMLALALAGASNQQLKDASDAIILGNLKPWEFEAQFNVDIPTYVDHIDLIEVAPGQAGLKIYGGRIHTERMQDLPIEPDAFISASDRPLLIQYCGNDLNVTIDLLKSLSEQLELRERMSAEYGVDLRSKSDAQIAEAVIKVELEKTKGGRVYKADFRPGVKFCYRTPDFIRFKTPQLVDTLAMVQAATFVATRTGKVEMPKALEEARIHIGSSVYRMGIGGLHSSESTVAHFSDSNVVLIDRDVRSYYPEIIRQLGLYPKHLGPDFLKVYGRIIDRRLTAKDEGRDSEANSLKIVVNGSFGKFGSQYSVLCSHDLLIQTTLTGQLSLLMLIESLELNGIPVVSANTDGVVIKCPRDKEPLLNYLVGCWEMNTGFDTEETRYKAVYSRDVNNYIAVYEKPVKGKHAKSKGAYAPTGLQKNPTANICVEAVIDYLVHGKAFEDTITECEDIRKFVVVRQVKGGAIQGYSTYKPNAKVGEKRQAVEEAGFTAVDKKTWEQPLDPAHYDLDSAYVEATQIRDPQYLGKAVRWYYADGETRDIRYKAVNTSGAHNKVPDSEGARPVLQLPSELPTDIDYGWYINKSEEIMRAIGASDYLPAKDDDL